MAVEDIQTDSDLKEEIISEEVPAGTLKNRLLARSKEIRKDVAEEMSNLKAPLSIQDLVRRTHSNRVSITRIVTEILQENKLPISMVKIGNADVIYRTDVPDLPDIDKDTTKGE